MSGVEMKTQYANTQAAAWDWPQVAFQTVSIHATQLFETVSTKVLDSLRDTATCIKKNVDEFKPIAYDAAYRTHALMVRFSEDMVKKAKEQINEIQTFAQTSFENVKRGVLELEPLAREVASRVCELVPPVFMTLAATVLFMTQSTLFTIGFLVGIIHPQMIDDATKRICDAWSRQSILNRGLIVSGAIIAWPISFAISAVLVGGNVGLACQR